MSDHFENTIVIKMQSRKAPWCRFYAHQLLGGGSLHASPTVSVDLKFAVELKSFSDASRVCKPANESLFLVTCRLRKSSEPFS